MKGSSEGYRWAVSYLGVSIGLNNSNRVLGPIVRNTPNTIGDYLGPDI